MKISKHTLTPTTNGIASRAVAFLSLFALLAGTLSLGVNAQRGTASQKASLTEDQRILHVLNRLGFGARPGDVARVKAMGLENYINLQLNPEKITDAISEAKVKNLATLNMTTTELYEKFPQPGLLLRQLERRGEMPAGLATARASRAKSGSLAGSPEPARGAAGEMQAAEMKAEAGVAGRAAMDKSGDKPGVDNPNPDGTPRDEATEKSNEKYRQALREYYQQNGLQLPQRITAELQASRILRAVYSERQLQEVMVDFWTNHFNVFAGKGADRWLLVSYDRDSIRPNAMGKFSDLLGATAQSPAMLFYLDNFQSVSPDAKVGLQRPQGGQGQLAPLAQRPQRDPSGLSMGGRRNQRIDGYPNARPQQQLPSATIPELPANAERRRRGINENYARELMELHTVGVDGGYSQKDVQEVARCFTGWTILAPRGRAAVGNGPRAERLRENAGKFFFNPRVHDDGEKIVLGHKIPAGGGFKDGLMVLDILAHHPATAKSVATKLARYFVSDNPASALVNRVAAAFTRSNGNIRETLRAIFSSPEFNSPEAYRAKVKRPFELAISAIRTLGADTTGGPQLHQWIARMGEPLYGFQTPNGYSDTAESWVNTGGLLERLNFGLSLASNRIPGTRVDLKQFLGNANGGQPLGKAKTMDRFLNLIVAGDIAPKTKEALLKQLNEQTALVVPAMTETARTNDSMANEMMEAQPPFKQRQQRQAAARADANITDPVTKIVGLILGSPEFQRQ